MLIITSILYLGMDSSVMIHTLAYYEFVHLKFRIKFWFKYGRSAKFDLTEV